jgi:uncharacterized protein YbaR (Trm112 family)
MIHEHSIAILRCPLDRSQLRLAEPKLVARLNAAIAAGRLTNRGGTQLEKSLDGALVREAGDLAYPIVDQIPVMLADEAIAIDQLPTD